MADPVISTEILASALDRRADQYAIDVESAAKGCAPRGTLVEKARLLVTCHDMWQEAIDGVADDV